MAYQPGHDGLFQQTSKCRFQHARLSSRSSVGCPVAGVCVCVCVEMEGPRRCAFRRQGGRNGAGMVADAKDKGATLLTEWKREGNLVYPMLIDNVTTGMKLAWEEQFGPVVPVMRISDAAEAVEHCNTSRLALQGCVFTADINAAIKMSDAMKTGTVQVPDPAPCRPDPPPPASPLGHSVCARCLCAALGLCFDPWHGV